MPRKTGVPGEAATSRLPILAPVPGLGGDSERLRPISHPDEDLAVGGRDSDFAESSWGLRCLSPAGGNLGPGRSLARAGVPGFYAPCQPGFWALGVEGSGNLGLPLEWSA